VRLRRDCTQPASVRRPAPSPRRLPGRGDHMTSLDVLRVSRMVPASPERVFRAWTTPDDMKRWFGRPEGFDVPNVEIDLRVGGRYRIELALDDVRPVCLGTYHVIEPYDTLTFSFGWETPFVPVMDT